MKWKECRGKIGEKVISEIATSYYTKKVKFFQCSIRTKSNL
jgi:hypothetical protein